MRPPLLGVTLTLLTLATLTLAQDTIQPPSVIMTEPETVIKSQLNERFSFACRATGAPAPQISWYKDDVIIPRSSDNPNADPQVDRAGNLNFKAKSIRANKVGSYQCKAENSYGTSQSNLTKLQMATFEDFAAVPATIPPTAVDEGNPLQVKCDYQGDPFSYPTPIWSWVLQSSLTSTTAQQTSVTLDGRLSLDPRGVLYFQHVIPSDNSQNWFHMCEAWNPILQIKKNGSPAQLRIRPVANPAEKEAKLVYTNGPNIEVIAGQNIAMYCIFEGYPTVQVRWEKLGNSPTPFFNLENGNTKLVLEDSKNTNQFEGQYRCQGFQPGKPVVAAASATFNVSVLQKPRFVSGPANVNITDGKSVEITCEVIAEPPAEITWFVNGQTLNELPVDIRRTISATTITNLQSRSTYKFTKLRRGTSPADSDLQVVTCMASSKKADGTEIGRSYLDGYVNVVAVMSFTVKPQNINITEDTAKVVLDCEVTADPGINPRVSWHYESVPVVLKTDKIVQAPNNSLIIYPPEFDNLDQVLGEYVCVAETFSPKEVIKTSVFVYREGGGYVPVTAASISLWWIGLVLALIILIIIILLIFCCLKRHAGGQTHDVDKVEREMGNDPIKDLQSNGFHDYLPKEKAPIEGKRELEDFSLDAMDNEGYDEDNDSLEQYGVDNYPGEYGVAPGRQNPAYQPPYGDRYPEPGYPSYGADPGYGVHLGNPAFVSDEAEV